MLIGDPWRGTSAALALMGWLCLTACSEGPAIEVTRDSGGGERLALNADGTSGGGDAPGQYLDAPSTLGPPTAWQCADRRVETRIESGEAGRLRLALPGGTLWLDHRRAASGARYSDEAGAGAFVFWNKGDSARLSIDGETLDCQLSDARSPWAAAQEAGAQLRAVGQEPGWVLIVETGADGKRIRMERMGHGEEIWHARLRDDGLSYETPGGEVIVEVSVAPCADTMSGERFPVAVTVHVGDDILRGCGRHYLRET